MTTESTPIIPSENGERKESRLRGRDIGSHPARTNVQLPGAVAAASRRAQVWKQSGAVVE